MDGTLDSGLPYRRLAVSVIAAKKVSLLAIDSAASQHDADLTTVLAADDDR